MKVREEGSEEWETVEAKDPERASEYYAEQLLGASDSDENLQVSVEVDTIGDGIVVFDVYTKKMYAYETKATRRK